MRLAAALLFGFLLPPLSAADWIHINSGHFEIYTTAPERQGRQVLESFERARSFFIRSESPLAGSPPPVTIIGFYDPRQYKPYALKDADVAYFLTGDYGDFIVMGDVELQQLRIATHEYVHLLVKHSGMSLPLWLNEGLAEVYSTMETHDGKILVGNLAADRTRALGGRNWLRLPAVIAAGTGSREYNDPNQGTMFYAQSGLLVHMLMLGEEYRDKFASFVERVSSSGSSQTAFGEVYGRSVAQIETEMNRYFRQRTIGGSAHKDSFAGAEIRLARPATEAETEVLLATLVAQLGRPAEARKRLEALTAKFPEHPAAQAALAGVEARAGDRDAALGHYRSALEHGFDDPRTYWDYARLLDAAGGEAQPRVQALQQAVQRNPDLTEARLRLAQNLHQTGRFGDELSVLQGAKNVSPEHALSLYVAMAYAAAGLNKDAEARQYAEAARKAVRKPNETAGVESLVRYLEKSGPEIRQRPAEAAGEPDASEQGGQPKRPVLRRAPERVDGK
jgi:Flp pilus assembly protein TadD